MFITELLHIVLLRYTIRAENYHRSLYVDLEPLYGTTNFISLKDMGHKCSINMPLSLEMYLQDREGSNQSLLYLLRKAGNLTVIRRRALKKEDMSFTKFSFLKTCSKLAGEGTDGAGMNLQRRGLSLSLCHL
jgi:hypothetical protein